MTTVAAATTMTSTKKEDDDHEDDNNDYVDDEDDVKDEAAAVATGVSLLSGLLLLLLLVQLHFRLLCCRTLHLRSRTCTDVLTHKHTNTRIHSSNTHTTHLMARRWAAERKASERPVTYHTAMRPGIRNMGPP